jgi:hypothetical protein
MAAISSTENGKSGAVCPSVAGDASSLPGVAPLVDQIGGPEAMASILIPSVEIFYSKLLSDERINRFFVGVDTERLKVGRLVGGLFPCLPFFSFVLLCFALFCFVSLVSCGIFMPKCILIHL